LTCGFQVGISVATPCFRASTMRFVHVSVCSHGRAGVVTERSGEKHPNRVAQRKVPRVAGVEEPEHLNENFVNLSLHNVPVNARGAKRTLPQSRGSIPSEKKFAIRGLPPNKGIKEWTLPREGGLVH
jgi:hypothetical protein